MNADMKVKWVAALRSGEYQQVRERLRHVVGKEVGGYCCLGVLCDISQAGRWDYDQYIVPSDGPEDEGTSVSDGELPPVLLRELHISDTQQSQLIRMNDDEGQDFAAIANYVEANL